MCYTWGLARFTVELQGGQGQRHQGVPLHVPALVHLVALLGSELDPKYDTNQNAIPGTLTGLLSDYSAAIGAFI